MSEQQPIDQQVKIPGFLHALCTFVAIIVVIAAGLFIWKTSLHSLLLICLLIASTSAWCLGYDFQTIRQAMSSGIGDALSAIYIFILIGVLIAAFIESGTLATLIYYGISWLSPTLFLPMGLILCSLMSVATGTSWGTVGTIGIVLMGIGTAMGIPTPVVAGMIVSGACFGDKMSPMSDTTNLAAMAAGSELYRHISSMCYTTVPTYFLVLVFFTLASVHYGYHGLPATELARLQTGLSTHFDLSLWTLLPIFLMLMLSFYRFAAEPTMMAAAVTAVIISVGLQGQSLSAVLISLYDGGSIQTGQESLDQLFHRGGMSAMLWTLSLSLQALALGGILKHCQFLQVLICVLLRRIKSASTLVMTTLGCCFVGNVTMGEAYMSIILGGQLFQDAYDQHELDRRVLSRSLEEGATLTTALIPWTTGGAFFASTLGVSVIDYAPWALLNWLNILISALFASFGIALFKHKKISLKLQQS